MSVSFVSLGYVKQKPRIVIVDDQLDLEVPVPEEIILDVSAPEEIICEVVV